MRQRDCTECGVRLERCKCTEKINAKAARMRQRDCTECGVRLERCKCTEKINANKGSENENRT